MRDTMSVFGRCLGAAGVQGFYGEGHLHYKIPGRNPDFRGMTLVSKTFTLKARPGNVKSPWKFWELFRPSWARVERFSQHTLNAMGLPNPGIRALLQDAVWSKINQPFLISIMAVENTLQKRLDELKRMGEIFAEFIAKYDWYGNFSVPFGKVGLQVNRSCPNAGHSINVSEIVEESAKGLEILGWLGWPMVEKFAVDTAPVEAVAQLQHISRCAGVCIGNTVKFNYRGLGKKIFKTEVSPLTHLGGGGISGPELLPLHCDYIKNLRDLGFTKNIHGLGGIFCPDDVDKYCQAGADSVGVGTVAFHDLRQVALIIQRAHSLVWR